MKEILQLAELKATIKTQTREEINPEVLADYTEVAKAAKAKGADSPFPPLVVFRDAEFVNWLGGGFTRRQALVKAGFEETECEVREGTARDAIAFGFKDNLEHGARLTNEDKKHNLAMALDDEEWSEYTNTALADLLGVSESFVRTNRPVAKAPGVRVSVDKKTGAKKKVTATRSPKGQPEAKPADKPADAPAKDDKNPEKKPDAVDENLAKIAAAIDGHGFSAEKFVESVTSGSLPLSAPHLKAWAQTSPERIRTAAPLVVNLRWSVAKAFAFLDKEPDDKTKAEDFINTAIAHGGVAKEKVGGFCFLVFEAAKHTLKCNDDGSFVITRKATK